jgi:hypothetical protein
MTNNKQSSVEKMFQEMIEIQQSGKKLTFDENLALLEKYKAMHKEEKIKFATDFFFWWYNQTSGTNTVEAVEQYYNETFGNEQQ